MIFANSGTDFPPIIEGLSEAEGKGMPLHKAITMPLESAAMGMAHGYYLATGRAHAVMEHTNVGLANAAIGAINAACDNIPTLVIGHCDGSSDGRRPRPLPAFDQGRCDFGDRWFGAVVP